MSNEGCSVSGSRVVCFKVNGTTQANYDAQQLQTTGGQTSSDRAASTRLKYNKNHKEAEGLELFLAVLAEHQDQQNQSVFSPTY